MKPASSWEYRYKFLILILSQPALAFLGSWACGLDGVWYAPDFTVATGVVAVTVGLVGCLLRIWGVSSLSVTVMASKNPDTQELVTTGIFGAVRNPLYLGTILLFGAYGLFFDWKVAVAFTVFHWVRYDRVARFEEGRLEADWGLLFHHYCSMVPRWVPRLRHLTLDRAVFSPEGVRANALFVGMWLGLLASTLTGNLLALLPFELAGGVLMAVHFAQTGRTSGTSRRAFELESDSSDFGVDVDTKKVA